MITEKQQEYALKTAIEITKEYSRGGGDQPDAILKNTYKELTKIIDEIYPIKE